MEHFEIEDLVVQDASGVLFRAVDRRTGNPVALRRLFPGGPEERGLNASEQAVYEEAIGRLSALSHPALRAIVGGGCDPVDGMPFIATEWVEGDRLQAYLDHGSLKAEEAIHLLDKAMEVAELVAGALGAEGVWIETGPNTIVIGNESSGRDTTFWVAPLRWLKKEKHRGMKPVVALAEAVTGWGGKKSISPQAGHGLGGWLNWLRENEAKTNLKEAREKLAAMIGKGAGDAAASPTKPMQPTRKMVAGGGGKKSSGLSAALVGVVFLALLGGAGYYFVRQNALKVAELEKQETTDLPVVPQRDEVPSPAPDVAEKKAETAQAAKPTAPKAPETRAAGNVFAPSDRRAIAGKQGEQVSIEGPMEKVAYSVSKKTMYILFANHTGNEDTRGAIATSDIPTGLSESELSKLEGKRIRINGKVRIERGGRPVVDLLNRNAVTVVE